MLVFLSGTRLFHDHVDGLEHSLGFPNGGGVGSLERGGGLALLWMNEVCVQLKHYDKLHMDAMVIDPDMGGELWRFTGFYGESRRELWYRSWELMKYLNAQSAARHVWVGMEPIFRIFRI